MSLSSPRELFVHELADMMSAESIIAGMLPELASEVHHPDLAAAFKNHEKETKAQVKRLKDIFKLLGEKPEETTCYATQGLKQEHDSLHVEKPTPEVLEMAIVMGGCKTEHYEIASYAGLVQMAKDLGEKEVAELLSETLAEEEAMAKQLTAFSKQLGKEAKSAEKVATK
jgi:ferritin-like metal-binding protein YciE